MKKRSVEAEAGRRRVGEEKNLVKVKRRGEGGIKKNQTRQKQEGRNYYGGGRVR